MENHSLIGRVTFVRRSVWRLFSCLLLLGVLVALPSLARAQTTRAPPDKGYIFHDEQVVERFVVQRWVSATFPDVSPSGNCDCITVVYEGNHLVLNLGVNAEITRVASAGADITCDGRLELIVTHDSNGAHCCEATTIYSSEAAARELLSGSTGNCTGHLVDLDRNGTPEFETCDDAFAYAFCSFASSPLPAVVFAYDARKAAFTLATSRYVQFLAEEAQRNLSDARAVMRANRDNPEAYRCPALGPALALIYGGRVNEGIALFEELYDRPDRPLLEQKVLGIARMSPLWIEP